jgi:nitrous oxidase accessory protein NosD
MRNAVKCALTITTGSAITLALALAPQAARAGTASGTTLYVSAAPPSYGDDGTSCATATYQTITGAIADAAGGDTIIVCPGTYPESVTVDKPLTLQGLPGAVIDARGWPAGVRVVADGATVTGLTVIVAPSA